MYVYIYTHTSTAHQVGLVALPVALAAPLHELGILAASRGLPPVAFEAFGTALLAALSQVRD